VSHRPGHRTGGGPRPAVQRVPAALARLAATRAWQRLAVTALSFSALAAYAERLLSASGLEGDKAEVVARLLVTADAMGHSTHGLALLADYLDELATGRMARTGLPDTISDRGAALIWDGKRLPGVWLTEKAMTEAITRARIHGLAAVAIRRSHHIGCLASFLPQATEAGMMAIIACSDPSDAVMAPHGGTHSVFTPDPVAIGFPTDGNPILVDISAAITTSAMSARLRREGNRFRGDWVQDSRGRASDDPAVLIADPPGTLLPTGGKDHGHKGYGLALAIEALSQGLSGYGRANGETIWGASVYVQVIDPEAFAGLAAFIQQTGWVAHACRASPAADPACPVRVPGDQAMAGLRRAQNEDIVLYPGILEALRPWAHRLSVMEP
jgi:LDH2 family malate/lactate/ureidoglycolate dehydrogenase